MVWVLVGLCVVGFGISSYFTGVAYHWVRPDTRWIPAVCRLGQFCTCRDRLAHWTL